MALASTCAGSAGFCGTISFEKNSALYCANNMSLRSIVPYPEIGLRGGVLTFEHLPLHDTVRSALAALLFASGIRCPGPPEKRVHKVSTQTDRRRCWEDAPGVLRNLSIGHYSHLLAPTCRDKSETILFRLPNFCLGGDWAEHGRQTKLHREAQGTDRFRGSTSRCGSSGSSRN